jgi:hypothetical protein
MELGVGLQEHAATPSLEELCRKANLKVSPFGTSLMGLEEDKSFGVGVETLIYIVSSTR